MSPVRHNPQRPEMQTGVAIILRQAQEKAGELTALLDELARCTSADALSGEAGGKGSRSDPVDTSVLPAKGQTTGSIAETARAHRPGRPPKLQKYDMQAYQLWQFLGLRQAEVAEKLNEEHGTNYFQGHVSRMISRARRHMQATGLPLPVRMSAKPARAVDPGVLELGRRTDGRRTDGRQSKRGPDEQ